jgi:DegV family protein with EDD domain
MRDYVIFTDSTTDLPASMADELGLRVIPLGFSFGDENYFDYLDRRDMDINKFYERIKNGEQSTTTLINTARFIENFEPVLKEGKDILFIAFSSGLSGTYQSSVVAAEELNGKYKDTKVICVDTKAASMGEGLLVYYAAKKKQEGMSIDELNQWLIDNCLKMCHWFTVDDLNHLKRGGRISGVTATLGTALNIKPVMHVDDEGHLIPVSNVRGRKKSLHALFEHMEETCTNPENQVIFISHSNALEDAEYLGNMIKEKLHVKDVVINFVGPVIGAHTGLGTIALFFFGSVR